MQTNQIQINVIDNQPVISTLIVAENTDREHRSIRLLVEEHQQDFEDFGKVSFEMIPSENSKTNQMIKIANLNEQQATLLITYLRNNDKVREFKKNLVKAFFMMKERLQGNNQPVVSNHILQQIVASNQETTVAIVKMSQNLETMFKTMLDTNNNMVRLKSEVREKLEQTNHKLSNLQVSASASRDASEQTKDDIQEIRAVVDKLEVYHRRDTLTSEQLTRIRRVIKETAKELAVENNMLPDDVEMIIYSRLKARFYVGSYYEIKSESFVKALDFIENISVCRDECEGA